MFANLRPAVLGWIVAMLACGGASPERKNDMAKALDNTKAGGGDKKTQAENIKKFKAKADEDHKKLHEAELQKLTTLAPPLSTDLEAACNDAAAGLDVFMKARATGDELGRWNAIRDPDMRKLAEECKTAGKPEVGACVGSAFRNASAAEFATGAQIEIREACAKRYGGAPTAPPQ